MPPLLAPDSVTNAISRTEPVLGPKHSNTALFGTRYLLNYSDDDNDDVGSDNDCDDVVAQLFRASFLVCGESVINGAYAI